MIRCVNENCGKNPMDSLAHVVVNCDGDMACDEHCRAEYEKQRDKFFNETIHDDDKFAEYMGVPPEDI